MYNQTTKKCGIPFTRNLTHPRYWLTWFGLIIVAIFAQLPTSIRHTIARGIGNYIYKNNAKRRNNVATNLKIAFPTLTDTTREKMTQKHLQWYACALVDYSVLFFATKRRLSNMLVIDGQEHIDNAIKQDKSIIILLSHSVMLDFAPAALGPIGQNYQSFASYKSAKNPVLDWMIARGRCRNLKFLVSRDEGLRRLVKSLKPKWLMIFLPDEDLGTENSTYAPFFGTQKSTLTTTSRLAKMGKSVALPTFAWYDEKSRKYRVQILPKLENYPSKDATQDATILNQSLEIMINAHPEQYMWTMKWYRTRPNDEPPLY